MRSFMMSFPMVDAWQPTMAPLRAFRLMRVMQGRRPGKPRPWKYVQVQEDEFIAEKFRSRAALRRRSTGGGFDPYLGATMLGLHAARGGGPTSTERDREAAEWRIHEIIGAINTTEPESTADCALKIRALLDRPFRHVRRRSRRRPHLAAPGRRVPRGRALD